MPRRLPVVSEVRGSLNADGSYTTAYPADVHGRFATARKIVFVLLMAIYAVLPWIPVHGHPAVQLDIESRSFFLFGLTFNAQDLPMTFFLLTGTVFVLLFATAVAGRVWCGFACPQTVFLEAVYRRIERIVEGPREVRMRNDLGEWTAGQFLRKIVKHTLFVIASIIIAHILLSYFVSIPRVFAMVRHSPADHPSVFIIAVVVTAALYGNYAFFREQLCLGLCPYGRLQGVLTDRDSLSVGYDAKRGEPRGKASDRSAGACVDCHRCVVVCPTGIDIRDGIQLDCIGCTACIDACDEIMDKLHRPRGLVRVDSERVFQGEPRRFWRPRLFIYVALGVVGVIVMTLTLRQHLEFEANLLRLQGAPWTVEDGVVRNSFELHVVNKRNEPATYRIVGEPAQDVSWTIPLSTVRLDSLGSVDAPVLVAIPTAAVHGDRPLRLRVYREGTDPSVGKLVTVSFLAP
ncbi:MAG: cytochrome c oxidase accessory protein CcoG [Deltaproteobacteria bacterium]